MEKADTHGGPSARLQARLTDRDNNFDVLRLVAAALVLVSHAFFLTGHRDPVDPLTDESGLGSIGVLIFFAISGLLVTRSWLNEPRVLPFAIKRALRILPGLVVVLVFTGYVLGPLVTTADRLDYLTGAPPAKYVVGHTLMLGDRSFMPGRLMGTAPNVLPGVFEDHRSEHMNGALWTLPVEVAAYGLVLLAGLLLVFWRAGTARILLAIALASTTMMALRGGGEIAYPLLAAFAGGALLYLVRSQVALTAPLFAAAAALWVASYHLPLVPQLLLVGLTVPYVVVFLGFGAIDRLRPLTRPGDVSYGLYLYHWPVCQAVISATGAGSLVVVTALTAVVTYILAFASWRLVERPALRLKGRLSRPSVRRTVTGSKPDLAPEGAPAAG
jgi:peptidoglycan/LPS O-acetylase OafA/YrhL